jgi:VIT1/CCC1 family predicted Fe2+/Mn2+ transporter
MGIRSVLSNIGLPGRRLPVYTVLPTTPTTPAASHSDMEESVDGDCHVSMAYPARRISLPSLSRFLADFTLGFADGLTVPFALTAGLSSLGQTDTVIYAGMAEICAGSISMGIGGYLSARGDVATAPTKESEMLEVDSDQEKLIRSSNHSLVEDYLAPLQLPEHLLDAMRMHIHDEPAVVKAIRQAQTDESSIEEQKAAPILSGLSVAFGYLLGGLLPLFPYFYVDEVGAGLQWSFLICVLALFAFGFTKHYLLQDQAANEPWAFQSNRRTARWHIVKQSLWEGVQMVILGSLAALAALLCVKGFEGFVT